MKDPTFRSFGDGETEQNIHFPVVSRVEQRDKRQDLWSSEDWRYRDVVCFLSQTCQFGRFRHKNREITGVQDLKTQTVIQRYRKMVGGCYI